MATTAAVAAWQMHCTSTTAAIPDGTYVVVSSAAVTTVEIIYIIITAVVDMVSDVTPVAVDDANVAVAVETACIMVAVVVLEDVQSGSERSLDKR